MPKVYVPRKARDLRETHVKIKHGPWVPKQREPKPIHDICRAMGGKATRYPTIRASIKGYRKLERKLNPPPQLRKLKIKGLAFSFSIR